MTRIITKVGWVWGFDDTPRVQGRCLGKSGISSRVVAFQKLICWQLGIIDDIFIVYVTIEGGLFQQVVAKIIKYNEDVRFDIIFDFYSFSCNVPPKNIKIRPGGCMEFMMAFFLDGVHDVCVFFW